MVSKFSRAFFPLVVLAVIAALTIGATSVCCIGNICLFGDADGDGDARTVEGDARAVEGAAVSWKTDVVSLKCDDFYIVAEGQTFKADVDEVDVHSDAGDETYCTLELVWPENGVEMRLNIYFRSDGSQWWSDEIRTYDGQTPGDWLYYTAGDFFKTDLGEPFNGSVEITSGLTSRIHFGGLTLQAFLSPPPAPAPEPEPVTGVGLDRVEATILTGSTQQLVATVSPLDATDQGISWSSTDEAVASVDESGLVSGVKVGSATITATTIDGGFTAGCAVTVVSFLELAITPGDDNQSLVYSPGSEIGFLLTMQNPADEALVLACSDAQVYDIEVFNSDNVLVWNWAHGQSLESTGAGLSIDPGESITYEEAWDQRDNDGDQVPAGTYAVYGSCVCGSVLTPDGTVRGPQYIEITPPAIIGEGDQTPA